jgi:hypothetical protein
MTHGVAGLLLVAESMTEALRDGWFICGYIRVYSCPFAVPFSACRP